jgi:1,4-dihydroxy-6-naphthoate synthase
MDTPLRLGISTCPNDTFTFHGILTGTTPTRGIEFDVSLLDVQELNQGLRAGTFDVAKGSFAVGMELADRYQVLAVGAALGYGNGPLLLAPREERGSQEQRVILGPGRDTTAELLFRMFYPDAGPVTSVVFSEIMPALQQGEADLGICIHEGRFTYAEQGLRKVEDLGLRWEAATHCPLPLGGIFADKRLDPDHTAAIQGALKDSLAYAQTHPQEALISMRRYAQEQSDEVLMGHVELYVNENTQDLGETGRQALIRLELEARKAGLLKEGGPSLHIFDGKPAGA